MMNVPDKTTCSQKNILQKRESSINDDVVQLTVNFGYSVIINVVLL